MKRSHYRGSVNWRDYDFMAEPGTEHGVLLARAMAEGNGWAVNNPKTNRLESGVTHVSWPLRVRGA